MKARTLRMLATPAAVAITVGFVATPSAARPGAARCHGVVATISGTDRAERLVGTNGRDVIAALGGDDYVDGRGGDDLICGGRGSDHLNGGAGSDRILGGQDRLMLTDEGTTERTGDVISGGPGSDRIAPGRDTRPADDVIRDVVTWASAPHAVHINLATRTATGQGRDTIEAGPIAVEGSEFADVIDGSSKNDRISAGGGADVVHAGTGDDVVSADTGHFNQATKDRIWGGRGDDQLSSKQGDDTLRGGSGNDVLDDFGLTTDALYGGPGQDLIVTELVFSDGPQIIDGGPDFDRVNLMTNKVNPDPSPGYGTWDMATGQLSLTLADTLTATVTNFEDADIAAYRTTWSVTGTEGDDVLRASGTAGTVFTALGGDDQFMGSAYADTFDGGPGNDRSLMMGEGTDTCVSVETFDYADCENIS